MSLVIFVLAVTQVSMCLVVWRVLKFEKAVIKAFDDFNSAHPNSSTQESKQSVGAVRSNCPVGLDSVCKS